MIKEGLLLLRDRFTTRVGIEPKVPTASAANPEDLSALEVFYASTSSTALSSNKDMSDNMSFVVDSKISTDLSVAEVSVRRLQEKKKLNKEKEMRNRREHMKDHIDRLVADDNETQPLSRFLHRHIRELATIDKLASSVEEEGEEESNGCAPIKTCKKNRVNYMSSSFLVDGVFPIADGLRKKADIRRLRSNHFTRLQECDRMKWSMIDADKSIVGTIFCPVTTSSSYEDNLQRLLLPAAFRFRMETQKINPRGAILAYMAMFAHDHDPIVDIPNKSPSTLRGVFSNILDGTMYEGHSMASLVEPVQVDSMYEKDDIKHFCDRVLRCSFYAIFLTLLGIKVWIPERYPEDRFVINSSKLVTIKLPLSEVIYDEKDQVWIFNNKKRSVCYVKDFTSLLNYMYYPEEAAAAACSDD